MSKKKYKDMVSVESEALPLDSCDIENSDDDEEEGFSYMNDSDSKGDLGEDEGSGNSSGGSNENLENNVGSVLSFVSECVVKEVPSRSKCRTSDPRDKNFGFCFYKTEAPKVDDLPERVPSVRELLPLLQMDDRDKKKKSIIANRRMSPSPTCFENQKLEQISPKYSTLRKNSPEGARELTSSPRNLKKGSPSSPRNLNQNPYIIRNYMERVNNLYKRQEELNEFQMRKNKAKEYSFKERSPPKLLNFGERSMKLNSEEKISPEVFRNPKHSIKAQENDINFIKATVAKYLNSTGGISLEPISHKEKSHLDSPVKSKITQTKREIPPIKMKK